MHATTTSRVTATAFARSIANNSSSTCAECVDSTEGRVLVVVHADAARQELLMVGL
jgi:hypothetical protein